MMMTVTQIEKEFERQAENLIHKNYHTAAQLSRDEFIDLLIPIRKRLKDIVVDMPDLERGYLPFVIVVKSDLLPTEKAMLLVKRGGKNGVTKLSPLDSIDFKVITQQNVPESEVYLIVDIDRGRENINLPPSEAMEIIKEKDRLPLTIDEGVAIVTQFPDFLIKNNCFSLLASRTGKDQRVPAIWINAKKEPNLGWCWNGNPHTWLGSASCVSRLD